MRSVRPVANAGYWQPLASSSEHESVEEVGVLSQAMDQLTIDRKKDTAQYLREVGLSDCLIGEEVDFAKLCIAYFQGKAPKELFSKLEEFQQYEHIDLSKISTVYKSFLQTSLADQVSHVSFLFFRKKDTRLEDPLCSMDLQFATGKISVLGSQPYEKRVEDIYKVYICTVEEQCLVPEKIVYKQHTLKQKILQVLDREDSSFPAQSHFFQLSGTIDMDGRKIEVIEGELLDSAQRINKEACSNILLSTNPTMTPTMWHVLHEDAFTPSTTYFKQIITTKNGPIDFYKTLLEHEGMLSREEILDEISQWSAALQSIENLKIDQELVGIWRRSSYSELPLRQYPLLTHHSIRTGLLGLHWVFLLAIRQAIVEFGIDGIDLRKCQAILTYLTLATMSTNDTGQDYTALPPHIMNYRKTVASLIITVFMSVFASSKEPNIPFVVVLGLLQWAINTEHLLNSTQLPPYITHQNLRRIPLTEMQTQEYRSHWMRYGQFLGGA